jgi:hypothetical protein
MSSVEAVETRLIIAEVAASLAPVEFSSRASSSSSSESLRMMTLPSPGGPRKAQLRSSGLFHVKASLARVSQYGMKTGGGATAGGARGTIAEVVSEAS